jgi:uncharacterized protein (DUF2147 family)
MTRLLASVLFLLSASEAHASPNLLGSWLTQDHDGVIVISSCGDGVCARIAGVFLDRPNDPMPVDYRGVSQCELPLITDAAQIRPNLWKGHITDPRNGSVYGVELHLDPHGNLALHGFLGIPLLGRTQTWTRYTGKVPSDCRIQPANTVTSHTQSLPNRPRPGP